MRQSGDAESYQRLTLLPSMSDPVNNRDVCNHRHMMRGTSGDTARLSEVHVYTRGTDKPSGTADPNTIRPLVREEQGNTRLRAFKKSKALTASFPAEY